MNITKSQKRIMDGGIELLQQNSEAVVEEIILSSNVSRGTFYKYFDSKQDFVKQVALYSLELTEEKLRPVFEDTNISAIHKIKAVFEEIIPMGKYFSFLSVFPFLSYDDEVSAIYAEQLEVLKAVVVEAQQDKSIRSDVPVEWIVEQIDALLYAGWNALQKGDIAKNKISQLAFESFMNGNK